MSSVFFTLFYDNILYTKKGVVFMRNGYWMKNTGVNDILLINIGQKSHISFLNRNPNLFNLSSEEVKRQYACYSEPIGYEGRARNDLMIMALKNGWIRVRNHKPPQDNWIIQCGNNEKCMIYVSKLLYYLSHDKKKISDFQKVTVSDMEGNVVEYTEFVEGKGFFFSEERLASMKEIELEEKCFWYNGRIQITFFTTRV
jgi:hypothetical protein